MGQYEYGMSGRMKQPPFQLSSRQEDEFEFVVAPVIELLLVVVVKVMLFIFSLIIND